MYSDLNMRSTRQGTQLHADDRTTRARIRDTAIECYAAHGVAETTVRKIAAAAEVSPGLVIHHFGSMEGLRSTCDEHVASVIRDRKDEAMSAGPGLDLLSSLRNAGYGPLVGYLAQVLTDDSPAVAKLVDDLVADAEIYLHHGVASGMLRPTDDPRGRAAVVALWSLGALVLHHHLNRILGVDLTSPDAASEPAFLGYIRPAMEVMGTGMFTDAFAAQVQGSLAPHDEDEEGQR